MLARKTSEPTPTKKCPSYQKASIVSFHKKTMKNEGEIQKMAMQVLQDEREFRLAFVFAARLTHRAGRRIQEKGPIVSLAIVIARHAKSQREGKDQQGRRPFPEMMVRIDQR